MLLNSYVEEDAERFATLIELYTQDKYYLLQVNSNYCRTNIAD